MTVKHLSAVKWWLSGATAVTALVATAFSGRAAILLTVSGGVLSVVSWILEKVVERRSALTTWPHQFQQGQRAALVRTLEASGRGVITVAYVRTNDDARVFAEYLGSVLSEAGWQTTIGALYWTPNPEPIGLELRITAMFPLTPPLAILRRELRRLGFQVTQTTDTESPMEVGRLIIGGRPR